MFRHLVQLNPSILAAIKQRAAERQTQHAAPPPAETPPPRPPGAMGAAQFAHMQRRTNGTPAQHNPVMRRILLRRGSMMDYTPQGFGPSSISGPVLSYLRAVLAHLVRLPLKMYPTGGNGPAT